MTPPLDVTVIGAGLLGLATANELLERRPRLRLAVVEKEAAPAIHQSGRNSGVIHSGIYYRPGSLKARLCVAGRAAMTRFCGEHGVRVSTPGKLMLATRPGEIGRLRDLLERGRANGVAGLEIVTPERVREIEPHAGGVGGLWSPTTGIVDFRSVAEVLAGRIRAAGGEIRCSSAVESLERRGSGLVLHTATGPIQSRHLVNCAGLHADLVAAMAGTRPPVQIVPFRGEYFRLSAEAARWVRGLIYPVPDPALPFLGVHLHRTVADEVHAGPNAVLAAAREGYRWRDVSFTGLARTLAYPGFWRMARREWRAGWMELRRSVSRRIFLADLQALVPALREGHLERARSGVRAQAVDRQGRLLDDFRIEVAPGSIHVLNAPSPAATSSLVIGRHIADLAEKSFEL